MTSIGLVGCGTVAHTNYAQTLIGRAAYSVRYVYDRNPDQAASAARVFGAQVASLDQIAEQSDAVIVSTPPASHAEIVRSCLRPGAVVLCEKPFVTTARDAASLCSEARELGAELYVGHFRRVFPQVELARALIELGTIGEITELLALEGGRFTWNAVSAYTVRERTGGVLWDTGSHTLDMAFHVACLDVPDRMAILGVQVERDKDEPSHEFRATFALGVDGATVEGRLNLSRRQVLPNLIRVTGTRGSISFVTDMDDRLRLSTERGTAVLEAKHAYGELGECFDVQFRRILTQEGADLFAAERFVRQIQLIEALSDA